ncbi:MAG: tetratricopeptide repeat protein [Treponema sp.]|jgi:tetratricopeptide (TPR) repeat protein|nr:tetratricopeptide repeat protein [Treponema sp.]
MGKDKTEQAETGDKIAFFLQKHRKPLLALGIIIIAGIVFSVAFFTIRGVLEKKAIAKVEDLERRINEQGILYDAIDSDSVAAMLEELNNFTASGFTFGYAAARAYSLSADIYFTRSEWNKAEEAWVLASRKAPKIYIAPIALFNAAVAAEEQGKLNEAIGYFKESLEFSVINPAAPRARFNIGRIHEQCNEIEKARDAYHELIEKNPDSPWANLAHNRLIVLEKS